MVCQTLPQKKADASADGFQVAPWCEWEKQRFQDRKSLLLCLWHLQPLYCPASENLGYREREIAAALSDLSQWVTTIETSRSNHVTVQVQRLSSLILPGYLHTSLYDCKLFNSTRSIKSNPGLSIFFLELQNHAIANEHQNIIYTCFFFIIRATSRFG